MSTSLDREEFDPGNVTADMPRAAISRWVKMMRSAAFILPYTLYLTFILGLGQRLVIWPLITLWPAGRYRVVGPWLRAAARTTLWMARTLAGVRVRWQGSIPAEPVVVVMNHQSVLDIPLGVMLMPGPQTQVVTRLKYKYGLPGISPLTRLGQMPYVSQAVPMPREELAGLMAAADRVANGDCSILIFPEGHRAQTGEMFPFMKAGLRLVFKRAHRNVYMIVADGMLGTRTLASTSMNIAQRSVRAKIYGPFKPPTAAAELNSFIDDLEEKMRAYLAELRNG
jgi:1-acyl-sn-glycerol-3-phosphate acyltransferase